MIRFLQLFRPKPKPPTFTQGQRIKVYPTRNHVAVGARLESNDKYCSIYSCAVLTFVRETDERLYFEYKSFFKPLEYEPKDGEIIFFNKRNFKALKYRKV